MSGFNVSQSTLQLTDYTYEDIKKKFLGIMDTIYLFFGVASTVWKLMTLECGMDTALR